METYTFDCGEPKHVANFSKTQEYLANYVQHTFDYFITNIGELIQAMALLNGAIPDMVADGVQGMGEIQQKMWLDA